MKNKKNEIYLEKILLAGKIILKKAQENKKIEEKIKERSNF